MKKFSVHDIKVDTVTFWNRACKRKDHISFCIFFAETFNVAGKKIQALFPSW